ncbi:hypothetical protein K469DRAFT_685223 [Zopfia rhizophila CBS 207.26]|uniref:F-box domain-containing protein n=1 Tax=Zopfia rhizophila CBS 207.26 TaxID=1314779 RepID=A0A6A6DB15_9PEZI|nr:hypothetical protein K469DRAFT_685223 [Zopfia rhizophila CBS 207.26]
MRNPANLPLEPFGDVLDYAVHGNLDVKSLCTFCLVGRQWYVTSIPRIYSKWTYNGEYRSFISLWKFSRTILSNFRVAEQVRTLDIRNWGFHPLGHSEVNLHTDLLQEDLKLIRGAIHNARIQELESDIMKALHRADRRPPMALLLTRLPNLTTICAHVPESDVVLAEVLKQALKDQDNRPQQQTLQNLKEASLPSEWHYPSTQDARDLYTLRLDYLWPLFRLPNIRKLSLFDFEPHGVAILFGDTAGASPITHLTLV